MTYVMALTKIGNNPDQASWMMATFAERPSVKEGDTYQFEDEPTELWRVDAIFRDHRR